MELLESEVARDQQPDRPVDSGGANDRRDSAERLTDQRRLSGGREEAEAQLLGEFEGDGATVESTDKGCRRGVRSDRWWSGASGRRDTARRTGGARRTASEKPGRRCVDGRRRFRGSVRVK